MVSCIVFTEILAENRKRIDNFSAAFYHVVYGKASGTRVPDAAPAAFRNLIDDPGKQDLEIAGDCCQNQEEK